MKALSLKPVKTQMKFCGICDWLWKRQIVRAKQMIQAACPDDLMEVECLTTDRETGRVFIVLRCLDMEKTPGEDHS
jgi:hypothetical protein